MHGDDSCKLLQRNDFCLLVDLPESECKRKSDCRTNLRRSFALTFFLGFSYDHNEMIQEMRTRWVAAVVYVVVVVIVSAALPRFFFFARDILFTRWTLSLSMFWSRCVKPTSSNAWLMRFFGTRHAQEWVL